VADSIQFLNVRLRFPNQWRWLALVVVFPALVGAIRLAHRMAGGVIPRHVLAAWMLLARLLLTVGLCLYVWFGRRRMGLAFDEARGEIVICLPGLVRKRLRRIGLVGFSRVRTEFRPHWHWFRAGQIVMEFADEHIEPIVEIPSLDSKASADADDLADAIFTTACHLRQAPAQVSIHAAIARGDREEETLVHELVVDGKKLPESEFGPVDLGQLGQSLVADGVYFIWSGDPGFSGRFSGVQVEHQGDAVHWSDRDLRRRYTFRLTELRSAFEGAISEARELRRRRPQVVIVPEHNEVLLAHDG
jgi:hypothetical protein